MSHRLKRLSILAICSLIALVAGLICSINMILSAFFAYGMLMFFLIDPNSIESISTKILEVFFIMLFLCSLLERVSLYPSQRWFNYKASHLINLFSRTCWFLFVYLVFFNPLSSNFESHSRVWWFFLVVSALLLLYNIPAAVWDIFCLKKSFREKVIARNKEYYDKYTSQPEECEENQPS